MFNVRAMQLQFYYQNHTRFEIIAPNIFLEWTNEIDILGIRKSGYIDEVEIKISTADFKADFKKITKVMGPEKYSGTDLYKMVDKNKHEAIEAGLGQANRFSFLLPDILVDQCDIPEYAGLYVYDSKQERVIEEKKPKLLHKKKISDQRKYLVVRKLAYRFWQSEKNIVSRLVESKNES